MLGSEILETAIGLVLVYSLLSMICSSAREAVEGILKARARTLEKGIEQLVGVPRSQEIYEHPMVFGLFDGDYTPSWNRGYSPKSLRMRRRLPSYIPARNFAIAFYDLSSGRQRVGLQERGSDVVRTSRGHDAPCEEEAGRRLKVAPRLAEQNADEVLPLVLDTTAAAANPALHEIEAWYNSSMDRVSGWYKRHTQLWVLLFAAIFTIALDVNTLTIGAHLYRNDAQRAYVMAHVEGRTATPLDSAAASEELANLGLPLRGTAEASRTNWFEDIPGWLLTVLAISLGAPFWFDVLNRLMVIRSTVKPHEKSREEGSEDRPSRSGDGGTGGTQPWQPIPLAMGSVPADTDAPPPGRPRRGKRTGKPQPGGASHTPPQCDAPD